MRHNPKLQGTIWALLLAAGVGVACEQSGQPRSGAGDQNVNARVDDQAQQDQSASSSQHVTGPAEIESSNQADSSGGQNVITGQQPSNQMAEENRSPQGDQENIPGDNNPSSLAERDEINPAIPRDTKGVPGSPYASNIDQEIPVDRNAAGSGVAIEGQNQNQGETSTREPASQAQNQDPNQRALNVQVPDQLKERIDVEQYEYSERNEFESFMTARLDAIDQAIDGMKAHKEPAAQEKSEASVNQAANLQGQISELDQKQTKVKERLAEIDDVPQAEWNQFKRSFRNDLVALEKDYQDLLVALRR